MRLRFDERDWERIERDHTAWWEHDLERPLVYLTGKAYEPGLSYPSIHKFASNYPLSMSAEQVVAEVTLDLEATRYYGDAFPRWFINFGPGILPGFLGARVHSVPETVWFEPERLAELDDLHPRRDDDNLWWHRVYDLTKTAVEAWQGQVAVSHVDLGGNLDALAALRTTQLLLTDLYDAPEDVDRLVSEITAHWLHYYDVLDATIRPTCRGTTCWTPIWSPERTYMLQCDFSYMISPAMFGRFVMPDIVACCERLDHGFYHLDGPGEIPHLDQLLSIPRLRGVQWIPGDGNSPAAEWLDLLQRIIAGGKLCQIFCTPEGALNVVRNLGGKGFMFVLQDPLEEDEARAFLQRLAQEDITL
jgi:5-methyltetrahydrofolate--homocysteine methyltransferase